MSDFARIVSWHILSGLVSRGGMTKTLCGRWIGQGALHMPDPPANEKTCERCWQLREQREP